MSLNYHDVKEYIGKSQEYWDMRFDILKKRIKKYEGKKINRMHIRELEELQKIYDELHGDEVIGSLNH